jgi:hypothetical protein
VSGGTGLARADDDFGGLDIRTPWGDVNVQWGDQPVHAPYVVQTRGPVHEAFAEPIVFDPHPDFVIPHRPPNPLNEVPPDIYPTVSGARITWIPGYWAWDDDRNNFVWVSGIWRNVPPGRQFVPGYWLEFVNGYQWVSGFWISEEAETILYLPQPPQTLERGPEGNPPGPNSVWVPGTWLWANNQYLWRPGYWAPAHPDWIWTPDHYVWAPSGYIFVNGYWDYHLTRRGLLFAPIEVATPVAGPPPQFVYRPSVVMNVSMLIGDLFARPSYSHYYFGDYYDRRYFRSGIYPAYAFYESDYGYDPLFASYIARQQRPRAEVIQRFRTEYHYLRDHPQVRPPRTYSAMQRLVERRDTLDPRLANRAQMARPITRLTEQRGAVPFQFERMRPERLDTYRQTITETRRFQDQRRQLETREPRYMPDQARATPRRGLDVSGLDIPGEQDGRVQRTTPDRPAPGPSIQRSTPSGATPDAQRDRSRTPDQQRQSAAPPDRPRAPDAAQPSATPDEPRSPSIQREQLPAETRRQLRERRTGQAEPDRPDASRQQAPPPPGLERQQERAQRGITGEPRDGRTARSAGPDAQPDASGRARSIERSRRDPVQLRLNRSPLSGRAATPDGDGKDGSDTRAERRAAPPPPPQAAEPQRRADVERRERPPRPPKED